MSAARLALVFALLAWAPGCPGGSNSPEQDVASFQQQLDLQVDGARLILELERLNVYLTEDELEYPEHFELRGPGTLIAGSFPLDVHIGYEEAWEKLIGRSLEIASESYDGQPSQVTLGEEGTLGVTGGTLTIDSWREGFDAKTPLEGKLELQLEDGRTLSGKVAVLGTSWG